MRFKFWKFRSRFRKTGYPLTRKEGLTRRIANHAPEDFLPSTWWKGDRERHECAPGNRRNGTKPDKQSGRLLDQVNLSTGWCTLQRTYQGGEKQRVVLADRLCEKSDSTAGGWTNHRTLDPKTAELLIRDHPGMPPRSLRCHWSLLPLAKVIEELSHRALWALMREDRYWWCPHGSSTAFYERSGDLGEQEKVRIGKRWSVPREINMT